jgi:hypothetical protein
LGRDKSYFTERGNAAMKRKIYHSVPTKTGWKVESKHRKISNHRTQAASEKAAIRAGHRVRDAGGLGQAVLHKKNGRIREERTYAA